MYPWLSLWAPHIHFPFSGNLDQDIHPNTSWFSDHIRYPAGDASIEEKAFSVASYGKQIGQITDVLLDIAQQVAPQSAEAKKALDSLKKIKKAVDAIKVVERNAAPVLTITAPAKRARRIA